MTDQILASVTVEEKDGEFFYALNDREPVGPFATQEAAAEAATNFLQSAYAALVKQTLFGDSK